MFEKILEGIDVKLSVDFFEDREELTSIAEKVIYTGPIDRFFDYKHGRLEYKSVRLEHEVLSSENYQGCSVMNYTEFSVPYTRIIEHKHFDNDNQKCTVISKEYPQEYTENVEPYYPVNDEVNNQIYLKYRKESEKLKNVFFGGRLAEYKYYDMHQVIASALTFVKTQIYE